MFCSHRMWVPCCCGVNCELLCLPKYFCFKYVAIYMKVKGWPKLVHGKGLNGWKKKKKESRRCNGPIKVQMSTWLQSLTELCVKKFQQNSMSWSNVVKKFLHNATRDCSFIQKSITSKFLLERFFYKLLTHVFNKNAKTSQRLKQSICFGAIHLLSEISHFCSSAFKATPIWRKITSVWLLLTNRRFKH